LAAQPKSKQISQNFYYALLLQQKMQQWKQDNSLLRDPYDENCNFKTRPRKKLKALTDWKELSQICSGTGQKIKFLLKNRAAVTKTVSDYYYHYY